MYVMYTNIEIKAVQKCVSSECVYAVLSCVIGIDKNDDFQYSQIKFSLIFFLLLTQAEPLYQKAHTARVFALHCAVRIVRTREGYEMIKRCFYC
jgi:hypothetical protein